MADLWMPGAERRPEGNGGGMAGGPPRAVWHITWDALGKGSKMPSFDNVANYLKNVDYCPHLMWDPWTGRTVQFYPANQSARALRNLSGGAETNRQGRACIQIETFFSPGAVVGGKRYNTVAETPCKGLGEIVAWLRSHGIPNVWPLGWPQWSGNSRSSATWATKAGHYGHCHIPENDHTDPGPMPRGMFEEDDVSAADVWNHPVDTGDGKWKAGTILGHLEKSQDETNDLVKQVLAELGKVNTRLANLEGKA